MKKITLSAGLFSACLLLLGCSNQAKTTTDSITTTSNVETTTVATTTNLPTTTDVISTSVDTTTNVDTTTEDVSTTTSDVATTTVVPTTTAATTTVAPTTTVNTTTAVQTTTENTTTVATTTNPISTTTEEVSTTTDIITTTDVITTTEDVSTTTTDTTPIVLKDTEVIMVGDSTMTAFTDAYYLPRYGYGTQMSNYFDSKATFNNLALSGRSSLSYMKDSEYTTMKNSLDSGDYLIIGFGHNDEKYGDDDRFRSADYDTIEDALADENSFASSLYNNYIKVAQDKGATPILATPITRLDSSNNYTGSVVHNTSYGNYQQTIIDLAEKLDLAVIDLTTATSSQYKSLGYDEAIYYHAILKGEYDTDGTTIKPVLSSVDATHINIYGAKYVAYTFSELLKDTNSYLKNYVKADNVAPTKENDLVPNSSYVPLSCSSVNWSTYSADAAFKTTTDGIYGTAFGDTGGSPAGKGFTATETSDGVFYVGQGTSGSAAGKISASTFGFAYAFKQIAFKENYTITAEAEVKTLLSGTTNQCGFGLMIRDDCYTPQKDQSITSNCICAGVLAQSGAYANMQYVNDKLSLSDANGKSYTTTMYSTGSTAKFTIVRNGQSITATTEYLGNTYTSTYVDFDLQAIDFDYYYLGMWSTRGTLVEFTNVTYTMTGEYTGA